MRIAVTIWALLMGADFITTQIALSQGHHEGNPLMAALFAYHGIPALIAKVLAIGLIMWIAYSLRNWHPMKYWMRGACIAMTLVVGNNLWVLTRSM